MGIWKIAINIYSKNFQAIKKTISDQIKIIRFKDDFLFGELADRAEKSKEGYASTYIGLPLQNLIPFQFPKLKKFLSYIPTSIHFYVFAEEKYVKQVVDYGNYNPRDPSEHDPKARSPFDIIKYWLKINYKPIINQNGNEASIDRQSLKKYLNYEKANTLPVTEKIFKNLMINVSSQKSINDLIQEAVIKVLAESWLNIPNLPAHFFEPIQHAEYHVFNRNKVSDSDFNALSSRIKAINDEYCSENEERIMASDFYPSDLVKKLGAKNLKDVNPLGSLIVEGNLTALITMAVLQITNSREFQLKLKSELKSILDPSLPLCQQYEKIRAAPFLDYIYLESLRFSAPAGPIARYVSKNSSIAPPRSYLFVPLRRILLGKAWGNDANKFNPMRHQSRSQKKKVNQFPFVPFSLGKRLCPASYGYVESIFKIGIATIFTHHKLNLKKGQPIEEIAIAAKQPRLKQKYYVTLEPEASRRSFLLAPSYSKMTGTKADPKKVVPQSIVEPVQERVYIKKK